MSFAGFFVTGISEFINLSLPQQFVIILLLVFATEVVVVALGYVYRAKVSLTSSGKY